jgi:hypothetical protein
VRCRAGGIRFEVGPDRVLTAADREALACLDPDSGLQAEAPFAIELAGEEPWSSDDPALYPQEEPPVLRWSDGCLLSSHRSFTAEIRPLEGRARLFRRVAAPYPIQAVIRAAMMARLPLVGGLPFHAAGVVVEGRGVVFFGPSGAGKSTLAATSPFPVASDELVAVTGGDSFMLVGSGFWGAARASERPRPAPLVALVDLAKGPRLRLEPLGPALAASRIAASVPVPLAPPLWTRALAIVADLVGRLPVYRMEWAPHEPPWERLEDVLPAARATRRT